MRRVRVLAPDPKRKARVAQALERTRFDLLRRFPFVGNLAMRLDLVPVMDDRLQTASTDGRRVFFDCAFYASLTSAQRLFVLAHEVWHVAMLHFARIGSRDRDRFNLAADIEIQFILLEQGLEPPWVLPCDEDWRFLSAEAIYDLLASPASSELPGDLGDDLAPEPEEPGEDRIRLDPDYAPLVEPDAEARTRAAIRQAAAYARGHGVGSLPFHAERLLREIARPVVDWRTALRRFVSPVYGGRRRWLPPNRRHVGDGLYLPSRREERLRAVLAIDTSGSTAELLPVFFAELAGLLRTFGRYELTVLQCDAAVSRTDQWTDSSPPPPVEEWLVTGFGGTDFHPVFDWVGRQKARPDALVYLTDGYGPAPEEPPPYPVLWAIPDLENLPVRAPAKWGVLLRIPRRDLRQ